jgi:DNA modification methylase
MNKFNVIYAEEDADSVSRNRGGTTYVNTGTRLKEKSKKSSTSKPNETLYARALPATRSGSLYGAFPYPTKISPEAIALFIATHTKPGDTVFDSFAGSGTTGLAALLCENPPQELRKEAQRLGLNVKWGARNAVLYELSALGAFIARTLNNPPDPEIFNKTANKLLSDVLQTDGWMYGAKDSDGKEGIIRYVVWSDLLQCPSCHRHISLWDASVSVNPACISHEFKCPACSFKCSIDDVERITETAKDNILGNERELRSRCIARIYGFTGKKTWSRASANEDLALIERIEQQAVPKAVPCVEIPWGDLYRSGYHKGITHVHHFYTRRNLIVFGRLWEQTNRYEGRLRDALRFWLLSYNASHATIMTRVVAKSGQKDLVVTSAQPGVLYISGLPVEKNIFEGLRRKLAVITNAFKTIYGRRAHIEIQQRSSCHVDLPDNSIDYVFTDPPFGGNIPYAEVNFINEAWLGRYTNRKEEIIISENEKKAVAEYQILLSSAFDEIHRVLKKSGKATVVFHSASAEVWNAFQSAYTKAGLSVEEASILDKTQGSFKQVTTAGAVRGDPLLLLGKCAQDDSKTVIPMQSIVDQIQRQAAQMFDPVEQTAQRLSSRLVSHCLANNQPVPLDAAAFYRLHAERHSTGVAVGAD